MKWAQFEYVLCLPMVFLCNLPDINVVQTPVLETRPWAVYYIGNRCFDNGTQTLASYISWMRSNLHRNHDTSTFCCSGLIQRTIVKQLPNDDCTKSVMWHSWASSAVRQDTQPSAKVTHFLRQLIKNWCQRKVSFQRMQRLISNQRHNLIFGEERSISETRNLERHSNQGCRGDALTFSHIWHSVSSLNDVKWSTGGSTRSRHIACMLFYHDGIIAIQRLRL